MIADKTIRARRSIRRYEAREIKIELIEEMLDLCRHAPSSMNGQPWRFIVVQDAALKLQLAQIKASRCPQEKSDFEAGFMREAPVIVAICVESERSYEREIENGVLAASYLMLAATDRGLGSVYLSAYRSSDPDLAREIATVLELSEEIEPIALIPLGYPAEKPLRKDLRPFREMVQYA
jgi:nitroreductase